MARTFAKKPSKRTSQSNRTSSHSSHQRPANAGNTTTTKPVCSAARPHNPSLNSNHKTTSDKKAVAPNRPATATKSTRAARPASNDHLASYFHDMSMHALLTPEQEKDMAQRIAYNEVATWATLLSNPAIAEYVIDLVEERLDNALEEFQAVRKTAVAARKTRSKIRKTRLQEAAKRAAEQVRALDLDRIHIDVILGHMEELRVGSPETNKTKLSFSPRSQSYAASMEAARQSDRLAVKLRQDFVHANLRLVVTMARRYDQGAMSLADLIQEGNLGLMHAVSRFDHTRGLRFSTYACWWIRHAIGRALADKSRTVRIPVHMLEAQAQLQKIHQKLSRELNRKPTAKELAKAANMSVNKIEQMHHYLMGGSVSLDRPVGEHDDRAFGELLTDPQTEANTLEDRMTARSMADLVRQLMNDLSPIEADVLRLRFGLRDHHERTFREIGDQYHLSRERIRQIQNTALGKLREALRDSM